MNKFGLIGFPLTHSFSKKYYDAKIEREQIPEVGYELYPIPDITDFPGLVEKDPQLMGINVTIPYKIAVMRYLDQLSPEAEAIAAVNCIRIERENSGRPVLTGYNTDVYGFAESLRPLLKPHHDAALILGNGGAAKAVSFALAQLNIAHTVVSRSAGNGQLAYEQLDAAVIGIHPLIVNTTPLGTYPDVMGCPGIPYDLLGERHLLYDLVYNPPETEFLKRGQAQGAAIKNGLEMLERQAERNWEIWNAGR
ncbi:MAG TPA: shikimate dehydrogenase [Parapedobacter sp.]|uniref:shikimate dehydrogenase family protein n=1 Tax=Parapedobacter sp. TaxID=1958893 RepID=UPI002CDCD81F|nr:shikimate dehydrogenase [Parapedobacter sp.]HWK58936.1 shikimate dehydrogenase [Parapedobacter sp.]